MKRPRKKTVDNCCQKKKVEHCSGRGVALMARPLPFLMAWPSVEELFFGFPYLRTDPDKHFEKVRSGFGFVF